MTMYDWSFYVACGHPYVTPALTTEEVAEEEFLDYVIHTMGHIQQRKISLISGLPRTSWL